MANDLAPRPLMWATPFLSYNDSDQPVTDVGDRHLDLGIARVQPPTDEGGANTMYYHTDHLGTT